MATASETSNQQSVLRPALDEGKPGRREAKCEESVERTVNSSGWLITDEGRH